MSTETRERIGMGERPGTGFTHRWHVAINQHAQKAGYAEMRFMYDAKTLADEVPRLALLFSMEREGRLAKVHHQCSHSAPEEVPANYLTCCLGVRCVECPHLAALDAADLTDEQRDAAKAWTCAAHIVSRGGDPANEGFILTVDDRMYWDRVYQSLAYDPDADLTPEVDS